MVRAALVLNAILLWAVAPTVYAQTSLPTNAQQSSPPKTKTAEHSDQPPWSVARFSYGSSGKRSKQLSLVKKGIFDRPYLARLGSASTNVAIGGYVDIVGGFKSEAGIDDGFAFEARRFNIFVTSQIADFVRLTSELEFEDGTSEIALETALVDLLLHHALNFRAGILLPPIGKFNVAHDSPIYDFVDRPLVSTRIIPSTLSEVGAGLFGLFVLPGNYRITYQAYVVNGLGSGLIAADGTRLSQGKSPQQFAGDENGVPATTGRISLSLPSAGAVQMDVGASWYAGIYNNFSSDGESLDDKRWVSIAALDVEAQWWRFQLRGEFAYAHVDVPKGLTDLHASDQWGFYLELVGQLLQRRLFVFDRAALFGAVRLDHIDLNANTRSVTNEAMGDETTRLSISLSFRPVPATALRIVYHHSWITDDLRNAIRSGAVQVGLASYF